MARRIPDIKTTLHLSEGDLETYFVCITYRSIDSYAFFRTHTGYGSYYVLIFSLYYMPLV